MALGFSQARGAAIRPSFGAKPMVARVAKAQGRCVLARVAGQYPDAALIAATRTEFPDKGVANAEEARCLWADGWTYLDVRPALEIEEMGRVTGSVNVPVKNMVKKYNPETQQRDYLKSDNKEEFLKTMKKRYPSLDAKLMVACSDGNTYSIDALELLDGAGYVNIVGLQGGFYNWFKTWDNKLSRRRGDGFTENSIAADGDSMGIHSTGGGFENMGKIETWVPKKY